ncbi:MAG: type II toxin-antitoxin system RelE/ParE family toxin, partial [Gallionella sp.]|nr:type II toxin-antitoxin system RelE/ParE family toxin [Gallionella sp.]
MLPVLWRTKARSGLALITGYIAERNPIAAQRLKDAIEQSVSNLPQHPYLYRSGLVAGTREIVVHPNYVVVYRVTIFAIEIINVLHS